MAALVIFDCDGVLVDTEARAARILAAYVTELGFKLDSAQADRWFRGRSLTDCMERLGHHLRLPEDFVAQLEERTLAAFATGVSAMPGVAEAIECLQRAGIATCVASSGSPKKMETTLTASGLRRFFGDELFSATQVARGKPWPDLFEFAARQMSYPVEQSVVVEDSVVGMQGALRAGAAVLGYVPEAGAKGRETRQQAEALGVRTFSEMARLPPLVAALSARDDKSGRSAP